MSMCILPLRLITTIPTNQEDAVARFVELTLTTTLVKNVAHFHIDVYLQLNTMDIL